MKRKELIQQEGAMKKSITALVLFCTVVILSSAGETGFSTQFGNYGLSDYEATDTDYAPYFQWGASLYYEDFSGTDENLFYRFDLVRAPVGGYCLESLLEFRKEWYSLGLGPVFGIINESLSLVKPGLQGRLKAQWPGKLFGEIGGMTVPAQYSGAENDYSTYSSFYTLGFYLRQNHILCYFTQTISDYSSTSRDAPYSDKYTSYIFYSDFYEKTSLFMIQTKLGYEILNKTFSDGSDIELRNILLGLQADFFINARASVFIGLDNKIYPGSYGDIELGSVPLYLVTVNSGFSWSF